MADNMMNLVLAGGAAFVAYRVIKGGGLGGDTAEPPAPNVLPIGSSPSKQPSSDSGSPSTGSGSTPSFDFDIPKRTRQQLQTDPQDTLPECSTISAQRVADLMDQFERGEIDPPVGAFADFVNKCSSSKITQAESLRGG